MPRKTPLLPWVGRLADGLPDCSIINTDEFWSSLRLDSIDAPLQNKVQNFDVLSVLHFLDLFIGNEIYHYWNRFRRWFMHWVTFPMNFKVPWHDSAPNRPCHTDSLTSASLLNSKMSIWWMWRYHIIPFCARGMNSGLIFLQIMPRSVPEVSRLKKLIHGSSQSDGN